MTQMYDGFRRSVWAVVAALTLGVVASIAGIQWLATGALGAVAGGGGMIFVMQRRHMQRRKARGSRTP